MTIVMPVLLSVLCPVGPSNSPSIPFVWDVCPSVHSSSVFICPSACLPHGLLSCRSLSNCSDAFLFPRFASALPFAFVFQSTPVCLPTYLSSLFNESCSPTPSLPTRLPSCLLALESLPSAFLSQSFLPALLPLRCWRPRGTLGLVLHIPEQLLM